MNYKTFFIIPNITVVWNVQPGLKVNMTDPASLISSARTQSNDNLYLFFFSSFICQ